MHFREAEISDVESIYELYRAVASREGGIARLEHEITEDYVRRFVEKSINSGLIIVCVHPDRPAELIAEVHAYKPEPLVFSHVLSHLTLVVHPEWQGKKVGRTIFSIFLQEIRTNRTDVGKVELITRESNTKAISLYQSLGFRVEGRLEMRIKANGGLYEADIPMGWQNPAFEF